MSYYKEDDPRNTNGVWEALNRILMKMSEIEQIIDEHFCELDDGFHWIKKPIDLEEEE